MQSGKKLIHTSGIFLEELINAADGTTLAGLTVGVFHRETIVLRDNATPAGRFAPDASWSMFLGGV